MDVEKWIMRYVDDNRFVLPRGAAKRSAKTIIKKLPRERNNLSSVWNKLIKRDKTIRLVWRSIVHISRRVGNELTCATRSDRIFSRYFQNLLRIFSDISSRYISPTSKNISFGSSCFGEYFLRSYPFVAGSFTTFWYPSPKKKKEKKMGARDEGKSEGGKRDRFGRGRERARTHHIHKYTHAHTHIHGR